MGELARELLTRIAEREAQAPDVHLDYCDSVSYDRDPCDCGEPDRILAWCTAMRAIVEEHAPEVRPVLKIVGKTVMGDPECRVCADWDEADYDGPPNASAPCRTLQLVAQALGL